ncbi:MAG: ABC transporter ATP-binding protein [Candidatus Korarchaeota archaeon]|nr:ABC transporter ATP-binding protein [Candidatus Korarchaeota archaeon]NIU81919.1 ATP-binding cassette domain-containing protein [Candidatus Thorarchaeota archaeon]NIW12377.1 ATP-binding cassette domain-containing protein [Candidatus Thorarchaeota archaeon]NIW51169.1 ATP-binding cassette domain-containing protein [Candidatus Korarchaeota archaeon]
MQLKNLHIQANGKEIVKDVSLEFENGGVYALLGPNASGKSTLVRAVMGVLGYQITHGRILFDGKDITDLPIEERSKLGIALAFQHPPAIKGVKLSKLLEKVSRHTVDHNEVGVDSDLLEREVNVNFSGGEQKLSELMQIFALDPTFAMFDEIDSGLDVERLEKLASLIKAKLLNAKVSTLFITHRGNIFNFLEPDVTHVMINGRIICSSRKWRTVWNVIEESGYEQCKECKGALLSS